MIDQPQSADRRLTRACSRDGAMTRTRMYQESRGQRETEGVWWTITTGIHRIFNDLTHRLSLSLSLSWLFFAGVYGVQLDDGCAALVLGGLEPPALFTLCHRVICHAGPSTAPSVTGVLRLRISPADGVSARGLGKLLVTSVHDHRFMFSSQTPRLAAKIIPTERRSGAVRS